VTCNAFSGKNRCVTVEALSFTSKTLSYCRTLGREVEYFYTQGAPKFTTAVQKKKGEGHENRIAFAGRASAHLCGNNAMRFVRQTNRRNPIQRTPDLQKMHRVRKNDLLADSVKPLCWL
jgi:hypothetical protein